MGLFDFLTKARTTKDAETTPDSTPAFAWDDASDAERLSYFANQLEPLLREGQRVQRTNESPLRVRWMHGPRPVELEVDEDGLSSLQILFPNHVGEFNLSAQLEDVALLESGSGPEVEAVQKGVAEGVFLWGWRAYLAGDFDVYQSLPDLLRTDLERTIRDRTLHNLCVQSQHLSMHFLLGPEGNQAIAPTLRALLELGHQLAAALMAGEAPIPARPNTVIGNHFASPPVTRVVCAYCNGTHFIEPSRTPRCPHCGAAA